MYAAKDAADRSKRRENTKGKQLRVKAKYFVVLCLSELLYILRACAVFRQKDIKRIYSALALLSTKFLILFICLLLSA